MMRDIENRADIEIIVNTFYEQVQKDEVIGYLFNDVAKTDWSHHLPKMYDFWEVILFGTGNFKGNPMFVHKQLHEQSPLRAEQFAHWLELFEQTVCSLYLGPNANDMMQSAANIAQTMAYKVLN
ncbi:MAG TPA: group III truncated hemoglobin [Flavobacterium sp.]|nr:group III truncated hemoglobin [Flavobacterium sp.]